MNAQLLRVYADELAWLTTRLNRQTADMESMEPESQDFRDAVLIADFFAREITAALQKLRANEGSAARNDSADVQIA